jgi:hypothetical protein
MSPRPVDREDPARLYVVTGGRSHAGEHTFDLIALIVSAADPVPGMPSEQARILRMCRRPMAVAEIAAALALPVRVVRIVLHDLLDDGAITVRAPSVPQAQLPDRSLLEQVLVGLRRL